MSGTILKIDARRNKILELLAQSGQVRVARLSQILGTSPVTIRSDLAALEQDGYLERIPGGAVQTIKNFYNLESQSRKSENARYKTAIASAVANMVNDGETLMINSGTTTFFTAVELKRHKNLNIVTNSISIAIELGEFPTFRVVLLGGEVNPQYSFTYGSDAIMQLKNYKADKTILSVDGVHSDMGITTYHAEEAVIDRLMMERSRQTIIAADYTKLNHESFFNIGAVSGGYTLVTNNCAIGTHLDKISRSGTEIILA